ncbi:hypothetical protein AAF712_006310 [Marasmius tenuissimus]|uniref:Ribosomal protein L12 n=1 Tax=Marasmius tenuissimus TaxID=585030 RepID=A0ABR2ZYC7_9AGAR
MGPERVELTVDRYHEGYEDEGSTYSFGAFLQLLPNVKHLELSVKVGTGLSDPALGDRILSSILSGLRVGKDTLLPVPKLEYLSLDISGLSLDIQAVEKVSDLLLERHGIGMQALRKFRLMGVNTMEKIPTHEKIVTKSAIIAKTDALAEKLGGTVVIIGSAGL